MRIVFSLAVAIGVCHSAFATSAFHAATINSSNTIGNSQIQLEFEGRFSDAQKQELSDWVEEMALAVANVYGEFPLDKARVKLVRSYSWREPVPWGEVKRRRGSKVVLHVNPDFSYAKLRADWTAAHEMSHLFLPYVGSDNKWFSEGLASYYQNIARGSVGLLTERETFQKLFHGFRRGERNAQRRPVRLSDASSSRGNNMRVYWSGAAYFFNVDVKLRQESNGKQSLATVLKQYKNCCLPNHSVTALWRVIDRLDRLSGTEIFTDEYQKIISSKQFPDYAETFQQLGITTGWGGIDFDSDLKKRRLRQSLLQSTKR
ncbi:MAG: hypothetical protein HWE16_00230 [Gammaproteobacteria bacterium]|nr:hypothetical protein [Gammaproteobacteria bacterium]